jgi:hypothetical protein
MTEGLDALSGDILALMAWLVTESVRGQNKLRKNMYCVLSPTKVETMLSQLPDNSRNSILSNLSCCHGC